MTHNFKNTKFQGNLLQLLELLYNDWIKQNEAHLPNYYTWLKSNINLYPIRGFQGYKERGDIIVNATKNYIIVDNEPLAWLYKHFTESPSNTLPNDIGSGIDNGQINASWSLEISTNLAKPKKGGVQSKFRDNGIWLAHIHDAANGLSASNPNLLDERFWRYLCLYNIFPWPSHRQTRQIITSTKLNIKSTKSDLSGIPEIQNLIWCFVKEKLKYQLKHLNEYELKISNHFQCDPNWEDFARDTMLNITPIQITTQGTTPKSEREALKEEFPNFLCDGSDAFKDATNKGYHYKDIHELVLGLLNWINNPNLKAKQLDGKCNSNQSEWIRVDINFFPNISHSIPQYDRHNRIIGHHVLNLNQFNGAYKLNADTKVKAILLFLNLYYQFCGADLSDIFEPAMTQGGILKLNLSGTNSASGFYMYKIK